MCRSPRVSLSASKEFDATLAAMSSLADRVSVRKLAALWRTGYALGLISGEHESRVGWSDDPLVAEALGTLGPGGLCMERSAADLRDLVEPLAELTSSAVLAGARQPEFTATGRRIIVTGTAGPLRTTIAEDLTDRGHQVRLADQLDTDSAGSPGSSGEHADAVVELRADGPPTEVTLRCHSTTDNPATTTLRLGVPYGPQIVGGTPLNDLVLQSLVKQPMRVSTMLPDAVRFAHVWDIAQAVALLVESPWPAGSFDICHDALVGPRELAELIGRTIRSVEIELTAAEPQLSPGPELHTERAADELGWQPSLDLAEGIRTVAQWLAYEE